MRTKRTGRMGVSLLYHESNDRAFTVNELLQQKCLQQFGSDLSLPECYELLKVLGPITGHNPEHLSFCNSFNLIIARFLLPLLQLFNLFGNCFTLLIYRLSYFDGSSSVNFLRAKAVANLIFWCTRTSSRNDAFEKLFWTTRPFVITLANISGTLSTWLTLFVAAETALCVLLPFSFRQLCTRKTTFTLLVLSIFFSVLLHLNYLYTHSVRSIISVRLSDEVFAPSNFLSPQMPFYLPPPSNATTSSPVCWFTYLFYTIQRPSSVHQFFVQFYYWSQMFLTIIIPTAAILLCAVLIVGKFITFKELGGKTFSQRRTCVLRLTIATALSHLLLEGPAVLSHGYAAIKGTEGATQSLCIVNHVNNLLSVVNATIPFYIFFLCNEQFRCMSTIYLKAQTELRREKKEALMAMALNRSRNGPGSQTERSFAAQMLIAKPSNL
ncbi:G-PROTEIN-RECEP-F1-2 domain-containing protein [Aphelenchoides fujianensis]|nr:G-PROTEIN-RECEP-F1-2 domain-containing protein [Aphelenchoides fujianensis]